MNCRSWIGQDVKAPPGEHAVPAVCENRSEPELLWPDQPQAQDSGGPATARDKKKGQQNDRISDQTAFVGFDAARLLLSLEAGDCLVARRIGRSDRPRLLSHSCGSGLSCAQSARPPL